MTKQEVLTKLAIECATWGDVVLKVPELSWHVERELLRFTKQDWLAERERLLNKPSWKDAPMDATHLAMDDDGAHCFFDCEPVKAVSSWMPDNDGATWPTSYAIAIPAGYDWRDSLEERPVDSNAGGIDSQTKQSIMKRFLTVQ